MIYGTRPHDADVRVGADADGPRGGHADARGLAAATVREQHDLGADFIKAALVTSEVFYLAQQECRRLGIPILGHLPNGIDVARASGEGVRSVEHLGPEVSVLACCSAEPQAVRDEMVAYPAPRPPSVESVDHLHRISGVVRGGRYLGPDDLDALKEKIAATRSAR